MKHCFLLLLCLTLGCQTTQDRVSFAIEHYHPLTFSYHDAPRLVHPHRLGISSTDALVLRAWEVSKAGAPSRTWKLYRLDKISQCDAVSNETFSLQPTHNPVADKAIKEILLEVKMP